MAKAWKVEGVEPQKSYRENAPTILSVRIEEVYSWAGFIRDVERKDELHSMRISIKRLRYSMELFAINYSKAFEAQQKVVVDLQGVLGDIHDCDILEEILTAYLQTLETQVGAETDAIGIKALMSRYREKRESKYQQFLTMWDALEQIDFKGKLLEITKQAEVVKESMLTSSDVNVEAPQTN